MPERAKKFSGKAGKGNSKFKIPSLYSNGEWVLYSKKFLKVNPYCYACGEKSESTDHWKAHKNNLELFWNPNNMLPLCNKCHSHVTNNYDRFTPPLTAEKLEWIQGQRMSLDISIRVTFVPLRPPPMERKKEFVE